MTVTLDRADIQGNVLLPYGRATFPMGHLLLFHADRASLETCGREGGDRTRLLRRFLQGLLPRISSGRLYRSKRTTELATVVDEPPTLTVNVAFSHSGLAAFGVPQTTLAGFPVEFQEGMRARAAVLNDTIDLWDEVWQERGETARIDLLILLRVHFARALAKSYRQQGIPDHLHRHCCDYHPEAVFEGARRLARRHLERRSEQLIRQADGLGLRLLTGHARSNQPATTERRWQHIETLTRTRDEDGLPSRCDDPALEGLGTDRRYGEYEHFGFLDGISDPVFEGQHATAQLQAEKVIGQGRLEQGRWQPVAPGEFLLGYPDEAQEQTAAAIPFSFSRNGTFLVVRKLHQDVAAFEQTINQHVPAFQAWLRQRPQQAQGLAEQGSEQGSEQDTDAREARLLLRAKLVGRWDDGTPLVVAPSYRRWQAFRADHQRLITAARPDRHGHRDQAALRELRLFRRRFRDVRYEPDDSDGARCPFGSHGRRSNPRDSGDPRLSEQASDRERQQAGSVLVNRRRILRRGMSYGERLRPQTDAADRATAYVDDGAERGTLFMALCAGLFRQFEFLQQQWLNYGAEFGGGNDVCPISGVMAPEDRSERSKLIIAAAADSARPPFVMRPAMAVECRGGAYFFVPSLTALRQIAQGMVDPI